MAARKPPAIVAELGRPETPEETAARKAETSRIHRRSQTMLSLIGATIASLAIVLFLAVPVMRSGPAPFESVDYRAVAAEARAPGDEPLIAPALPTGWSANSAENRTTEQVPTWYIGFVTPKTQFIAVEQGIGANPTWLAAVLDRGQPTGTTTIGGLTWSVYDRRASKDAGNFAYSLSTTVGGSTVVLHGTAVDAEFEVLAAAIGSGASG